MHHLRLLFWLKAILTWRNYRRDLSATVGAMLGLLLLLPSAIGLGVLLVASFLYVPDLWAAQILRSVLLFIYLFWVLAPLFGHELYESYDITRLFQFPVSHRLLFLGSIVSSLVDFPILFLLPIMGAALVGFTRSAPGFFLTAGALVLFLFHTVALSQAVYLASAGLMRNRRVRDLALLAVPVLIVGGYGLKRAFLPEMTRAHWRAVWDGVNYLPSGLAARAMGAARMGEFAEALPFLGGLGLVTLLTLLLSGRILQALAGGGSDGRRPQTPSSATAAGAAMRQPSAWETWLDRRAPPVVLAVAEKELRYMLREPYFRVTLIGLIYLLALAGFAYLEPTLRENLQRHGAMILWMATGFVLLSEVQLPFNMLGTEGSAAWLLFLSPGSRREILIGKNLTLFVALSLTNVLFAVLLAALANATAHLAPAIVWMELGLLLFLAAGNVISVWFPYPVVANGWKMLAQSAGRGCLYHFLYNAAAGVTFVLLLPVLAALLAPVIWKQPAWHALTVPLSAFYTGVLYLYSLQAAEPLLRRRELQVMESLAGEP